ncbi:MAG: carboxy terminal-processing peptidase [Bernardetiaceae bacterium]|nr:carboxy terminal-processing peptidase [Bernardetiaceae bacterium]
MALKIVPVLIIVAFLGTTTYSIISDNTENKQDFNIENYLENEGSQLSQTLSKAKTNGDSATLALAKRKILKQLLLQTLNSAHYEPIEVDDDFSKRAYKLYLKNLDNNKRYFTKGDIDKLDEYKLTLDDHFRDQNFEFYQITQDIFQKRLQDTKVFMKEILAEPFDFAKKESVELDGDKVDYPENEEALKERWRQLLKYQTLLRLDGLVSAEEDSTKQTISVGSKEFNELEEKAREQLLKSQTDFFRRMIKLDEKEWFSMYINALTSAFDPHTSYFPPQDKENFDISMSGQFEGIGATLQERDGNIRVERIVTGSASWKQGELESGDVILKVAQGEEQPVDVVGFRLSDAVELIRGKKGTEVRLTVRKIDGTTKVIPIIRDVVILEETYAKSTVIENEEGKRIGYIRLPSFYADFSGQSGGRSCSEDVKQELIKLKDENIDGIVLDLRNNGGGSLSDVVDMAGLFIEKGPIVQIKSRNRSPMVLSDKDPSVVYDGPLTIMVNGSSASASEIMAAAMQDYKRAIVVGTSATFGKGTVQQIIDFDRYLNAPQHAELKPMGALKITTQKFYRINGDATQLKGVVPDIIFPSEFSYIDFGEKEVDYALPWDGISRAKYKEYAAVNIKKLRASSEARMNDNEVFRMMEEAAKRLKQRYEATEYTLNFEDYRKKQKQLKKESEKYEQMKSQKHDLKIHTLKADIEYIESDESRKARTEQWHKDLQKDIQIYETLMIMSDLI